MHTAARRRVVYSQRHAKRRPHPALAATHDGCAHAHQRGHLHRTRRRPSHRAQGADDPVRHAPRSNQRRGSGPTMSEAVTTRLVPLLESLAPHAWRFIAFTSSLPPSGKATERSSAHLIATDRPTLHSPQVPDRGARRLRQSVRWAAPVHGARSAAALLVWRQPRARGHDLEAPGRLGHMRVGTARRGHAPCGCLAGRHRHRGLRVRVQCDRVRDPEGAG